MGAVGLAAASMNFGIDQPGPDRGDADTFACDFVSQSEGEGIDRAFGGRVIDIGVGRSEFCGNRRQVDDDAALAAMPRRHPFDGLARAKHAAGDVDGHHALDAFGRHLVNTRGRPDDAGIVDQRAERAERVGGLEQRENVALAADIAFHRDRLAVAGFDTRDDVAGGGFVVGVADTNPKTAGSGGNWGGGANAAASPGEDDDFVGHRKIRSAVDTLTYTTMSLWISA